MSSSLANVRPADTRPHGVISICMSPYRHYVHFTALTMYSRTSIARNTFETMKICSETGEVRAECS